MPTYTLHTWRACVVCHWWKWCRFAFCSKWWLSAAGDIRIAKFGTKCDKYIMQFENYGWRLNRVVEIMCNALDKWLSLEFVILWFWINTILFWLPPIQINWAGLTTAASCWSASNIIYTRRVHGLIMQNKADFKCLWPWVTNCFENMNTYMYTVKCRYNAVQFIVISETTLR